MVFNGDSWGYAMTIWWYGTVLRCIEVMQRCNSLYVDERDATVEGMYFIG